jgi:hypothetical protein
VDPLLYPSGNLHSLCTCTAAVFLSDIPKCGQLCFLLFQLIIICKYGFLQVYEMSSVKDNWGRSELLSDWHSNGGVMIMGYEMFRNLSQLCRVKNKKQKKIFTETLLDPGKLL